MKLILKIILISFLMSGVTIAEVKYELVREPHKTDGFSMQLYAELKGQRYFIHTSNDVGEYWAGEEGWGYDRPFEITRVIDLDGDGYLEAVVQTLNGGMAPISQWYIVSHRGGGFFTVETHNNLGTYKSYDPIEIKKMNGRTVIIITNVDEDEQHIFGLKFGKIELLAKLENLSLTPSEVEILSENLRVTSPQSIYSDMDMDGVEDEIKCKYWDRWGSMQCDIYASKNGHIFVSVGCKRTGVLKSIENGMKQLVCGKDTILSYDGYGIYDD